MNSSISHLPKEVQEKLQRLILCIRNEVPDTQYIILYGSYARGDYVDYDQRVEYGLRTCYQSDFDIVVLTPKIGMTQNSIYRLLRKASLKYAQGYADPKVPPVEFLAEYVEDFNESIKEGRYFYTDIVKEGIILYNSGKYDIEPLRELDYAQILEVSKRYYEAKFTKAETRFDVAQYLYTKQKFEDASFDLHQATENYLIAIILTASLYSEKTHNVFEMLQMTKLFTTNAIEIFHTDTEEGDRLLKLLQSAYIQSRYNKDFVVTKDDLDKLFEMVECLRVVTEKFCLAEIAEHEKRAIIL